MPRCTICTHPKHDEIDLALVGGASHRAVASQFQLQRASVQRHAGSHLQERIRRGAAAPSGAPDCTRLQSEGVRTDRDLANHVLDFERQANQHGATLRSHLLHDLRRFDALHHAAIQSGDGALAASHLRSKWLIAARAGLTARLDASLDGVEAKDELGAHQDIGDVQEALRAIVAAHRRAANDDNPDDGMHDDEEDDGDPETTTAAPEPPPVRVRVRTRPPR